MAFHEVYAISSSRQHVLACTVYLVMIYAALGQP